MILVHWSCQISNLSHIETEIVICKISIMMLWDHAHPYYIQSTTALCDNIIIIGTNICTYLPNGTTYKSKTL